MKLLIALVQLGAAVALGAVALITAYNLLLIANRPETISVVNTLVGQGVLIACLLALATVSLRRGLKNLRRK